MKENIKAIYARILEYATLHDFEEMQKALGIIGDDSNEMLADMDLQGSLEVSELLVNLHAAVTHDEEDAMVSAVLIREYIECLDGNLKENLVDELGFKPAVYEIVEAIIPRHNLTVEEQEEYYGRIQSNRVALLASIAERGYLVQNLHRFPTWVAHRYIDETKACYYSMCIYGREHYHELLSPITILMQKMKSLIGLAEIMLRRYEQRETELIEDILDLREDNAAIRGILAKFRAEQANSNTEE